MPVRMKAAGLDGIPSAEITERIKQSKVTKGPTLTRAIPIPLVYHQDLVARSW